MYLETKIQSKHKCLNTIHSVTFYLCHSFGPVSWRSRVFCHDSRTLLSLAHFFRVRMMYSTWGFPEFRSRTKTSLSVSLEHKQDMQENRIRPKNASSVLFILDSITPTHTDRRQYNHALNQQTGGEEKHTWAPCWPVWAERCRHMLLVCPPSN